MDLVEIILIMVGTIAVIMAAITVVRRISAFYRARYNISIWSGVLVLVIALVCTGLAFVRYETLYHPLTIVAVLLLLVTLLLDIHHAGIAMGLLALMLQMILAVVFIAVLIVAVVWYIIRAVRQGNDMVLDAVTGTTSGFRTGVSLFFRFFVP